MSKLLFSILLILAPFSVMADDTEKQLHEVKEQMKTMGDDNVPVSDEAKKKIDEVFSQPQKEGSTKKDRASQVSIDCKNWVDEGAIEKLKLTSKQVKIFTKAPDGTLGYLNEKTQSMLSVGKSNLYWKIVRDAVIGLTGDKPGMIYRPLKESSLRRDLTGMLQVVSLFAIEIGDQWGMTNKNGNPVLMLMFLNEKSEVLRKYYSVICVVDGTCTLISKERVDGDLKKVVLERNTPELAALQKKEMFSDLKFRALDQMCSDFTSDWFKKILAQDISDLNSYCRLPSKELFNLASVKSACGKLKSDLLPALRRFQ